MKKRIWELDAFRGLCVLGMVAVHAIYDMVELYRLVDWQYPALFLLIKDWGGIMFILLSGICVTLGSHHLKRGGMVLLCGLIVTAVTVALEKTGLFAEGLAIYFGVLHCLGVCMLLWGLFRKMPTWALSVLGALMAILGLWLNHQVFDTPPVLVVLGFAYPGFFSSDYFPLLPYLGFFLLGAVLGRTVYAKKESLLPRVNGENPGIRFFCFCGRQSLWIYLLHQPLLSALFWLIA